MTKKQQELYDKQIKKLNEHCLGPSEGKFDKLYITPLQALKNIEKEISDYEGFDENTYHQMDRTRFIIIETALKENKTLKKLYKAELKNTSYYNNLALKYKKALEIIKTKKVDAERFTESSTLEDYNKYFFKIGELTKEEYELLKAALNDAR